MFNEAKLIKKGDFKNAIFQSTKREGQSQLRSIKKIRGYTSATCHLSYLSYGYKHFPGYF